jgi:Rieske Fe-S protein
MDPYHYVRVQEIDGDAANAILIAGGEDHKTGQANDPAQRYAAVERWTRERFPAAREVAFHWSGQTMEPVDCLAYIGRNPKDAPNVFIATGDSGMGLTHGTIAGMLLTDLIAGRSNPWEKLYDPARITLKATPTYLKENLNVAKKYSDWLTPGEVKEVSEIAPDTGALMRRGATKLAVYRDREGELHACSAVCPHLGCIVTWNGTERTWDCPCHGSRFTPRGQVVNGPANTDLPAATLRDAPAVDETASAAAVAP